ncbi:MAG: hypothetical protein IMF11_05685 [Proteobacteria bacterium]|nr:hypothetical protein [Pseudomonadota bacterium]
MTKKETETTDVAVPGMGGVPVVGADIFDMGAQMEGVEAQLPQIKIIHQAQMFAFPDDTKEETFRGIILDMNRTNAYWPESYDDTGGGVPPMCSSLNGVVPEAGAEEVQSPSNSCFDCPQNKYGTGNKGKGKACKNMKRVHILLQGSMMPYRLTVPPTNLKAVDLYVSLLTSQGIPYQLVMTEFSLRTASNKDGVEYSELHMENVGPSVKTVEEAQELKALVAQWRGVMRGEIISSNEV